MSEAVQNDLLPVVTKNILLDERFKKNGKTDVADFEDNEVNMTANLDEVKRKKSLLTLLLVNDTIK